MTTYKTLDAQLTGRCAQCKKLCNNTYAERRESGIAIRLHNTDILTFQSDGSVVATTGGWKTVTTKSRLNEYLPHGYSISQERGLWFWTRYNGEFHKLDMFQDGDRIGSRGALFAQAVKGDEKESLKLRKRVNAYAKLCADALPLSEPSSGDCWFCLMMTQDGQSLGDANKDSSHLENHIEEGYVVPSLVYHALKERGYGPLVLSMAFGKCSGLSDSIRGLVKRAVAKYVFKRMGMAGK